MIDLRWRNTVLRFIAREFVTAVWFFDYLRRRAHAERVDPAARLHSNLRIDADDFRHKCPLEFRAESALRSGRIPEAEDQCCRAQFVEGSGVLQTRLIQRLPKFTFTERLPIMKAVTENRVGNPMRRFETAHAPDLIQQSDAGEIHIKHRDALERACVQCALQRFLQSVRLRLD